MESFEKAASAATSAPEPKEVLGLAGVIWDNQGAVTYSHFSGRRKLAADCPPVDLDTTFCLYSAGKFLTHVAALKLVQNGLIKLDEPIGKFVPEFDNMIVLLPANESSPASVYTTRPAATPLTLRHFLTNSTGIAFEDDHPLSAHVSKHAPLGSPERPDFPKNTPVIIKEYWRPLLHDPGQNWDYGHEVHFLQIIIERVTNKPFLDYMQTQVFDVLGLEFTAYIPKAREDILERQLQMVNRDDGKLVPAPEWINGITCSLRDMSKIFTDFISPQPRLLNAETRALLFEPGLEGPALAVYQKQAAEFAKQVDISEENVAVINYSLAGAMIVTGPGTNVPVGTLTWDGLANVAWAVNLERGISAVFATQLMPEYDEQTMAPRKEFFNGAWKK